MVQEVTAVPRDPPPTCDADGDLMVLVHYENKVALYKCPYCQKKVAIGEGRK